MVGGLGVVTVFRRCVLVVTRFTFVKGVSGSQANVSVLWTSSLLQGIVQCLASLPNCAEHFCHGRGVQVQSWTAYRFCAEPAVTCREAIAQRQVEASNARGIHGGVESTYGSTSCMSGQV